MSSIYIVDEDTKANLYVCPSVRMLHLPSVEDKVSITRIINDSNNEKLRRKQHLIVEVTDRIYNANLGSVKLFVKILESEDGGLDGGLGGSI